MMFRSAMTPASLFGEVREPLLTLASCWWWNRHRAAVHRAVRSMEPTLRWGRDCGGEIVCGCGRFSAPFGLMPDFKAASWRRPAARDVVVLCCRASVAALRQARHRCRASEFR
jgi:hypothetical protein